MPIKPQINGYTLIEVLVAMMILALALTVLMGMFSGGLRTLHTSADYAHAVLLAEGQLAAAGRSQATVAGESFGYDDRFRWTRTVAAYHPPALAEIDNLAVTPYRVTVVVEWPGRSGERRLALTTIKLDRRKTGGG